jgi:hypothetical protein
MNFHIHEFSKDRYRGEMSRQESPKILHKLSRLSNEGRRGTPSLTETPSDQRKSSERRILSNEYVNI